MSSVFDEYMKGFTAKLNMLKQKNPIYAKYIEGTLMFLSVGHIAINNNYTDKLELANTMLTIIKNDCGEIIYNSIVNAIIHLFNSSVHEYEPLVI